MRAALLDPQRRVVLSAGALVLLALGGLQAMYGPAFPGLTARFGIGVEAAGMTVVLHFAGSLVSTASSAILLTRVGYRPVLLSAGATMAIGAGVVALAPTWPWVLAGALLGGLGFGVSNVGFNLLSARVFAPNAAPPLNLLSALFGFGAVLGPLAVGAAGASLRIPFLVLAGVTAAGVVLTLRIPEPERDAGSGPGRIPWIAAFGFVLLYVFYVAAESGVATWETVHLEPALGARAAAYSTSVYWGAVTVGRLLAASLAAHVLPRTLVLLSTACAFAAVLAAHVLQVAPLAYAAAGLAFAPIFPTSLAWVERVFPRRSERVVPIALALANLGPVATTAIVGAWVAAAGPAVVPTALSVIVGILLVIVAGLWWATRGD